MSIFLPANENDVKDASAKANHPSKLNPLKDYFPPFIFDNTPLDLLPLNVNDYMAAIFCHTGETAVSIFNTVCAIMDGIMQEDDAIWRSHHFSKKAYLCMIATSVATWFENCQKQPCNWLPVVGGVLPKWAILLRYQYKLVWKQFSHARLILA